MRSRGSADASSPCYRLLWFHSRGKAESDAATRSRRMQKAIQDCTDLRERLQSARTRFRDRKKVETAVAAIIVGLLAVYFFALMLQSLLERELRQAMALSTTDTLPLSPEGRHCSRPTTRQLLDVFEPVMRQTL